LNADEYDYDKARREASELWLREQIAARMERFTARRPAVFAAPGTLDPRLAAWVDRFIAGHRGGLIIVGNVGSGKTWSLWKIQETLIQAGFFGVVEICPAHELRRLIAPPVDGAALDRFAAADIFAVDDIGSVRVSDWDSDHIMRLADTRWPHQRPTILTSNESDLRKLLGERVASRLSDGVTTVKMTGVDRRRGA
jgi:DNA replication protein DnaC